MIGRVIVANIIISMANNDLKVKLNFFHQNAIISHHQCDIQNQNEILHLVHVFSTKTGKKSFSLFLGGTTGTKKSKSSVYKVPMGKLFRMLSYL